MKNQMGMHPVYLVFFLVSLSSFARAWQEWIDQSATASSTVSTRLYAAAISFVSWSQADANNLCSSGLCGPYCDSVCNSTTTRNIAIIPDPSGETTGTNQTAGCLDTCCSSENCLRTLNSNGDDIGIDKEYVLIFGGREMTAASSSTSLFDQCEVDFLQVTSDGTCQGTPMNDLQLVDLDGNIIHKVVPTSVDIPSARYGHKAIYMERSEFDSTANVNIVKKYMYIYGGYSPDCGGYCNDLWRYEIPWAPQRYFPQNSTYWDRGNYWEKMSTTTNPGKRAWFSMVSDNREYIYLFGGAKEFSNKTRIYTNAIWKYSVTNNTWEQIVVRKPGTSVRKERLWDGTYQNLFDGPLIPPMDLASSDCVVEDTIPNCRAFSSMSFDNDTNQLIVSGGLNSDITTNNYRKALWSFDIKNRVWTILINESNAMRTPASTAFASATVNYIKAIFDWDRIISDTERRDSLWAFDFVLNRSVELIKQPLSDTQSYPSLNKGMTLVRLIKKRGVFLFGGYLKNNLTTGMQANKTAYLTKCQNNITANGLKVTDAFTSAWTAKYTATGDSCFASIPEYLTPENEFTINGKMWMYLESYCGVTNFSYGSCFWGRSKCNPGLFGADCSEEQCVNSMCYQETTSLQNAVCIHCYGKGECINGVCQCETGYTSDDCSAKECPNNCSNTATLTVATCKFMYPLSVCECFKDTKRGSDDCSYIFCLHDCSGHGDCVSGECVCDDNYYGTDCSIFDITFIQESTAKRFGASITVEIVLFFVFVLYDSFL